MADWRRLLLLFLTTVLLAACSMVQVGYNQLDRLIAWRLDDYLPLDSTQRAAVQPALTRWVDWHCSSQLPGYAGWLRQVDADLRAGADMARIDAHIDTVLGFARAAASEAAREIGPLVAGAKPEQIAALKRRFERNTREYVKDWVEPSQDDIVRERSTRLRERIENWIGRLTPAQRDIVDRWAREVHSRSDDSLESRRRWQAAMADLLARTDLAPDAFRRELEAMFVAPERHWTPGYAQAFRDNRARAAQALSELSASLTDAQRRHLQREVSSFAAELDGITCRTPTTQQARS
jgi:hypothetical protein